MKSPRPLLLCPSYTEAPSPNTQQMSPMDKEIERYSFPFPNNVCSLFLALSISKEKQTIPN